MTLLIIILGIFAIFILYHFAQIVKAFISLIISLLFYIIRIGTGGRFGCNHFSNTSLINQKVNKSTALTTHSTFTNYKRKQKNKPYSYQVAHKKRPKHTIQSESKRIKVEKPAGPLKSFLVFLGAIFDMFSVVIDLLG